MAMTHRAWGAAGPDPATSPPRPRVLDSFTGSWIRPATDPVPLLPRRPGARHELAAPLSSAPQGQSVNALDGHVHSAQYRAELVAFYRISLNLATVDVSGVRGRSTSA
jgi:hypothetical protein